MAHESTVRKTLFVYLAQYQPLLHACVHQHKLGVLEFRLLTAAMYMCTVFLYFLIVSTTTSSSAGNNH